MDVHFVKVKTLYVRKFLLLLILNYISFTSRHTPASHHGGNDRHSERDYDGQRGSSRNSPPTPVTPPSKFPASDSTTDYTKAASSSTFKSDRIRPRSSDSAGAIVSGGPGIDSAEAAAEARAKFQLHEYRRGEPPDQPGRPRSPRSPATRSSGM